jgi:flagellar motor switch protein FliN
VEDDGLIGNFEDISEAAEEVINATSSQSSPSRTLEFLLDVTLQTIQDLLQLGQGSVIELEKLAGEPLDIFLNGKQVARGEAVIVNEKFGVRLTDIISPEDRVESLR